MILKGSQRGGGQGLAVHLLNATDNEHIRLHELRGFTADDLKGAFKEVEAVSRGTKCREYLFSLSLSPPEAARVPERDFERAIETIEERLGLQGQPRAVIFHEKDGRRHAHCVWSRIDVETMTARPLPFFKRKLVAIGRDLYLEHGWKMPRGFDNPAERNPTNFTLAEWQQAKRQGVDPRWIKQAIQDCWAKSDNKAAFASALQERGFFLAKGDKRGFVIVNFDGDVQSLPRALGLKTKEVRARLGEGDDLPSVAQTLRTIGERMTPAIRRHIEEARAQFRQRSAKLAHYKMEMTHLHRDARVKLDTRHKAEVVVETRERAARLPKGFKAIWSFITGRYRLLRAQNEREAERSRERQAGERQTLIDGQRDQRAVLQAEFKELRKRQAQQLLILRSDVGRFLKMSRTDLGAPSRSQGAALDLKLQR